MDGWGMGGTQLADYKGEILYLSCGGTGELSAETVMFNITAKYGGW